MLDHKKIFEGIDPELLAKFKVFHKNNPHVFQAFGKYAFEMKRSGRKKSSAWLIINRCRWDADIRTDGEPFKISNDYIGLYSRLMIYQFPEFIGFFTLKTMKGQTPLSLKETL